MGTIFYYLKKSKSEFVAFILSSFYFFRQSLKLLPISNSKVVAANLDVFYVAGPVWILKNRQNKRALLLPLGFFLSLLLYAFIQILVYPSIDVLKVLINILKLALCFCSLLFAKEYYKECDIFKFCIYTTLFYFLFSVISMLDRRSVVFWTQNDVVNKYSLSRLQLFYLEPSELGFHIIIIAIFLIGFLMISRTKKTIIILILSLLLNVFVLILAKPLGAIGFGLISIAVMVLFDLFQSNSKHKRLIYLSLFFICLFIIIFLIITKNSLYLRIIDTINGRDSSNNFRITITYRFLVQSLFDTHGLGVGFGNLRTDVLIQKYSYLGYTTSLANSFPAFIAEGGLFAIIFLIGFFYFLFRKCLRSKSIIKWGVLIFLFLYQLFGGHFTSGLYWILYGIILSDFDEKSLM